MDLILGRLVENLQEQERAGDRGEGEGGRERRGRGEEGEVDN